MYDLGKYPLCTKCGKNGTTNKTGICTQCRTKPCKACGRDHIIRLKKSKYNSFSGLCSDCDRDLKVRSQFTDRPLTEGRRL